MIETKHYLESDSNLNCSLILGPHEKVEANIIGLGEAIASHGAMPKIQFLNHCLKDGFEEHRWCKLLNQLALLLPQLLVDVQLVLHFLRSQLILLTC